MRSRTVAILVAILVVISLVAAVSPAAADEHATSECSFPVDVTDATGTTVTVDDRPDRIVVLHPSAAQTVWELNASDRVVGAPVTQYTEYLDGIENKTDVTNADGFSINREAVVELDADLVLAPNITPDQTVEGLRDADQTVYKFGFGTSLQFIANKTTRTGQLIGACEEAADTNEQYWARIDAVQADANASDGPDVMHYSDGYTAGSNTFIDELITTAGGTNVAAEHGVEGYGELNEEALVEWNPDVIVVADDGPGVPENPAFESTFAVQNDQIVTVNGNYLSQPAPRIVNALETIAAAVAAAETADETPASEATDDDGESDEPAATPEEQSGFGGVVALVSLVAVAVLARRRSS